MTSDTRALPLVSHGEDLELRFQALVQSPLRAGLLRFLSSHRDTVSVTGEEAEKTGAQRRLDERLKTQLEIFAVRDLRQRAGV